MSSSLFPQDRIPGIDLASEKLAEAAVAGKIDVFLLGWSEDQTPIFLAGQKKAAESPQIFLIGAPQGDCVLGISAACQALLEPHPALEEWQVWTVVALDIPRLRENVIQLGQLNPTPEEHLRSRKSAWAPGEIPEENLPLHHKSYLQPDVYPVKGIPEGAVSCSAESLALARALHYLNPSLVVSLADQPVGYGSIEASQDIHHQDQQAMLRALCPQGEWDVLPALQSLSEDEIHLGGVKIWQWLALNHPDAVYLRANPARFNYPEGNAEDIVRDLEIHYEMRNTPSGEKMSGVYKLNRPGHPAHGIEVMVRVSEGEEQIPGPVQNYPISVGALAIEALMLRQVQLAPILELFEQAKDHLEGEYYPRALKILQDATRVDEEIKRYATQNQYSAQPSISQQNYWTLHFSWQTAVMLQEALRCLEDESKIDRKIIALRESIQVLYGQLEIEISGLLPRPGQEIIQDMQAFLGAACQSCLSGRPALLRTEHKAEELEAKLAVLQKQARNAKLLGYPRAEQKAARQAAEDAQQELTDVRSELAELRSSIEAPDHKLADLQDELSAVLEDEAQHTSDKQSEESSLVPVESGVSQEDETTTEEPEDPGIAEDSEAPKEESEVPKDLEDLEEEDPEATEATEGLETQEEELKTPEVPEAEDEPQPQEQKEVEAQIIEEDSIPSLADPSGQQPSDPGLQDSISDIIPLLVEAQTKEQETESQPPTEPELPPAPEPIRTEPVVIEAVEPEEKEELDIETLLPFKLEIPREWGHGALYWESQIPRIGEQPLLRGMLKKLMKRGKPADWYHKSLPQGELEESPQSGVEIQEPLQPGTVGITHARAVKFVRNRIGAEEHYSAAETRPPDLVFPRSPGVFLYRPKRRI